MIKQILLYLLVSVLIVFFAEYAHLMLVYLVTFYTFILVQLTPIFNNAPHAELIRNITTLVFFPILLVGVPALIYRLVKKQYMPYFFEITWVIWLIIVLGKVLIR